MTWTDLLELVMESDANGDGTIDLGEFIELMKRKSSETDQMEVSNSFYSNTTKNQDNYYKTLQNIFSWPDSRVIHYYLENFKTNII